MINDEDREQVSGHVVCSSEPSTPRNLTSKQKTPELTVMFVDDEEKLTDVYAGFLDDSYDVRTALSGEEALEKIVGVDIVFLDRRMPGLSVDKVVNRIMELGLDCRIAMLSAIEPDFEDAFGFDKYLIKPVTAETIRNTVEELRGYLRNPPE